MPKWSCSQATFTYIFIWWIITNTYVCTSFISSNIPFWKLRKKLKRGEEALKADIEAKQWTAKAEEARYLREMVQLETEKVRLEKEKIERDIALMKYNDLLRLQQTETKK